MVGSTDLVSVIGDGAWAVARGWHDSALRSSFDHHGGEEVSHAGDGFFVAFDDPGSAAACAIEIQRKLHAHRSEHGFALPVRIGLHTSAATLTPDGYAGRGVHCAARVAALADAHQILASADSIAAAGVPTAGEPRLETLKGLPEPVAVVEVRWLQ